MNALSTRENGNRLKDLGFRLCSIAENCLAECLNGRTLIVYNKDVTAVLSASLP